MRAREVLSAGTWDRATEIDRIDAVYDDRHRRRITLRTTGGRAILLDLAETRHLRDGDGLVVEDRGVVRICARAERLLEITAADPAHLMRLAWHLGNRHLETVLDADRLLIRDDHVIAGMIRGLGGTVRAIEAPFDPETGAYDH